MYISKAYNHKIYVKISRAQETQDVTMGNPQQGKTHEERSFLYNEETNTRAIETIL